MLGSIAEHRAQAALAPLADGVKPPFQFFIFAATPVKKRLANHRFGRSRQFAQTTVVGRHVAPAEQAEPLGLRFGRQGLFAGPAKFRLVRQEKHAHAVTPLRRQRESEPLGLGPQELVGDLQQDPRAVAGRLVGPRRTAVHQVQQHLLAALDDGMAAVAGNIDHRPDAAGIVLPLWVVQTANAWHGRGDSGGCDP